MRCCCSLLLVAVRGVLRHAACLACDCRAPSAERRALSAVPPLPPPRETIHPTVEREGAEALLDTTTKKDAG